ncbi:SecD/SecF/SecDF export membrane protein [Methanosalsum zhilinae DSM 4017]|uniref:Protein-export membrane protein SecD n=1 Tax=Methanosalsum zhilinae (strain DSM 4017 / NBRC 107636 / OCM 62 / WeN5) TaxID=679901 RepID=F7XQA9_METZD|nr:preprotein translocase subunit SecD [Methanosalsum zhilinae]AEH61571.1 SecD/SecF/SecDF export membrane protein [Methanosalsum zhilinae DSM 4017]
MNSKDEEPPGLLKDFRVRIFIIVLLLAVIAIQPWYSSDEGFTSNLQYGLDLEGGSWLQLRLAGGVAQLDADPGELVKEMIESITGEDVTIEEVRPATGTNGETYIRFTTTAELMQFELERLGMSDVSISQDNGLTVVEVTSTTERLILSYLSETLDTEVVTFTEPDGTYYEIRSEITQEELEELMNRVGGSIVRDEDGNPIFREGVTRETRDLTQKILSDKMNAMGLKDIPVRTVGDDYILIDFAGIDLATAREITEQPGRFEMRIQVDEQRTRHVLYGDDVVSVGMPAFHDEQWHTPFRLNEEGARKLQQVAIETGAVDNPTAHHLIMYLDDDEIYSAPLSFSAARSLKEAPIYSWQASTGGDEDSRERAEQLQIHLRAGALPVNVEIIGAGQVDATLGQQFKSQSLIVGLFALFAVASAVFIKYRRKEILVPMVGISIAEVVMILGFAAAIGWQLDLPSIAAIIAVIGTGIDHLIIITDEVLYEGKLPPTKVYLARITKAFAIIMGAAATTTVAMAPLVVLGFGALQGFALTTIVGVMLGVFIARPVYGKVIKKVLEDSEKSAAS